MIFNFSIHKLLKGLFLFNIFIKQKRKVYASMYFYMNYQRIIMVGNFWFFFFNFQLTSNWPTWPRWDTGWPAWTPITGCPHCPPSGTKKLCSMFRPNFTSSGLERRFLIITWTTLSLFRSTICNTRWYEQWSLYHVIYIIL